MTALVDVVFVLAIAVLFPDGKIAHVVDGYQTRDECRQNRVELEEQAKKSLANNKEIRIFFGECVAVDVKEYGQ